VLEDRKMKPKSLEYNEVEIFFVQYTLNSWVTTGPEVARVIEDLKIDTST
jgi:hypothetical protein